MNEPSSTLRVAAIEVAARMTEAAKLQVSGRGWRSEEHRLDLVAIRGDGILATVEVRAVEHGTLDACITPTCEDRIRQLAGPAREWTRGYDAAYHDPWMVIVTVDPDGSVKERSSPTRGDCTAALILRMGEMR
jgi:Holliday junction resolvase-like predicted endonuclease